MDTHGVSALGSLFIGMRGDHEGPIWVVASNKCQVEFRAYVIDSKTSPIQQGWVFDACYAIDSKPVISMHRLSAWKHGGYVTFAVFSPPQATDLGQALPLLRMLVQRGPIGVES
jgi:hypothetical protein